MNELLRGFLTGLSVGRSLKGWSSCPAEPAETETASAYRETAALNFSDNSSVRLVYERERLAMPAVRGEESVGIAYA